MKFRKSKNQINSNSDNLKQTSMAGSRSQSIVSNYMKPDVTIGFGHTTDQLNKRREFCQPITKYSEAKPRLTTLN